LVSINQTLTTEFGTSTATSSGVAAGSGGQAAATNAVTGTGASSSAIGSSAHTSAVAQGNLSVPQAKPSAQTVAHALDGTHGATQRHGIRDTPTH
jgi:hypothetical protein